MPLIASKLLLLLHEKLDSGAAFAADVFGKRIHIKLNMGANDVWV